jgi:hypothetical protein
MKRWGLFPNVPLRYVTGGAGKFEGKKGKGSFKGERIGSPKTGGDSYADFTGTEWK